MQERVREVVAETGRLDGAQDRGRDAGAAAYNVTFSGAYTDTAGLPSSDCSDPATSLCLSDPTLTGELSSFIAARGLPRGLSNQYFLFTPPGVGSGKKPPRFLNVGDVVTLGIDGLGTQRQQIVAA